VRGRHHGHGGETNALHGHSTEHVRQHGTDEKARNNHGLKERELGGGDFSTHGVCGEEGEGNEGSGADGEALAVGVSALTHVLANSLDPKCARSWCCSPAAPCGVALRAVHPHLQVPAHRTQSVECFSALVRSGVARVSRFPASVMLVARANGGNANSCEGTSAAAAAMLASCCRTVLPPTCRKLLATGSRRAGDVKLENN
jgi:hypothetical protein